MDVVALQQVVNIAASKVAVEKSRAMTAEGLLAPISFPTFTGTVSGISATMVGLGNVSNTADSAKPVSTAQQTALDLKATAANLTLETNRATAAEATLTASFGALPLNARDYSYGISGNTVTQNTVALQNAVNAAGTLGRPLYIPGGPTAIQINAAISLNTAGVKVFGDGERTSIQQTIVAVPIFVMNAAHCTIQGFALSNATRSVATATSDATDMQSDGSQLSTGHCGVKVAMGTNYATVLDIVGTTFHSVVNALAYGTSYSMIYGFRAENITMYDAAFGVLVRGVIDPIIKNVRGTYSLTPGIGHPPHIVYVSESSGILPPNTNVLIDGVQAWDGSTGAVVKTAGTNGGLITNIVGRNCRGLLDILNCNDLKMINVDSKDDNNSSTAAGVFKGSINLESCTHCLVTNGTIAFQAIDHMQGLSTLLSDDNVFLNIAITSNFVTTQTNQTYASVQIKGNRNRVERVSVNNIGVAYGSGFFLLNSTGTQLIRPKVTGNNRFGIAIDATALTSILDYVPADIVVGTTISGSRGIFSSSTLNTTYVTPATDAANIDKPLSWFGSTRPAAGSTGISQWGSGHNAASGGTWIWSGDGIANSSNGSNSSHYIDTTIANVDAELRIKFGGTATGHALHLVDTLNFLTVDLTATAVTIGAYEAGVATNLATSAAISATVGRQYTLRAVAFADKIEAWLDGVLMATHTLSSARNTTFASVTKHGLHASSASAAIFVWAKHRAV